MFAVIAACSLSSTGGSSAFYPGALWNDTEGNRIKAHSAGLLSHGGAFYWYGADNYSSGDNLNTQINVYQSTDLYNWENKGAAFVFDCKDVNSSKCYADRPKVIYNPTTKRFVMWMKSTPYTAVATSPSPLGPFRFESRFYPLGEENGDVTAFVDPQSPSDAYWIFSVKPAVEERVVRVAKMTPDWTNVTEVVSTIPYPREAPAAFFTGGSYYIWTSHTSGWSPNAAALYTSTSLAGPWTDVGNPTHNKTSFSSQSTYILPYTTKNGRERFIYIADRFEPYIKGSESGRYVWLPIDISSNGTVTVSWHDKWSLSDL